MGRQRATGGERRADAHVQAIRARIAQDGFVIAIVGANLVTDWPPFAYTIGVAATRGYEFAMSGGKVEDMHDALVTLTRRARAGQLHPTDNLLIEGVLPGGSVMRLRPADPSWCFHWIKPALELAEHPPVWQAQLPDRYDRWPGDRGYHPEPPQEDFTTPTGGGRCD